MTFELYEIEKHLKLRSKSSKILFIVGSIFIGPIRTVAVPVWSSSYDSIIALIEYPKSEAEH